MATPFVAGGGDPTADLPGADTFGKIADQWNTFLDQPGGRAALLQAGLQLMQPKGFGQSNFGQLGEAIGAGGEAAGRQEKMDIAQQEAASKQDLRGMQADLAGARAAGVGLEAQYKTEKLGHEKTKLEQAKTLAQFTGKLRLLDMHRRYQAEKDAINAARAKDVMNPAPGKPGHQPPDPILRFDEWLQTDPQAQAVALQSGLLGGTSTAPSQDTAGGPPRVTSPADAKARFPSGTQVTLPDGTVGTVP